jgi:hypothetical protein
VRSDEIEMIVDKVQLAVDSAIADAQRAFSPRVSAAPRAARVRR